MINARLEERKPPLEVEPGEYGLGGSGEPAEEDEG